jgi:hypothetical protein
MATRVFQIFPFVFFMFVANTSLAGPTLGGDLSLDESDDVYEQTAQDLWVTKPVDRLPQTTVNKDVVRVDFVKQEIPEFTEIKSLAEEDKEAIDLSISKSAGSLKNLRRKDANYMDEFLSSIMTNDADIKSISSILDENNIGEKVKKAQLGDVLPAASGLVSASNLASANREVKFEERKHLTRSPLTELLDTINEYMPGLLDVVFHPVSIGIFLLLLFFGVPVLLIAKKR